MQNQIGSILQAVGSILLAVAIVVVAVLGVNQAGQFLKVEQLKSRSQAIDGCAQTAVNKFSSQANGQANEISDINQSVYQKCLELKGIIQSK